MYYVVELIKIQVSSLNLNKEDKYSKQEVDYSCYWMFYICSKENVFEYDLSLGTIITMYL